MSLKEDPWEKRERERERWRQAAQQPRRSRPSYRSDTEVGEPGGLGEDFVVWGLLVAVAALLFSEVPTIALSTRTLLARAASLGLLLLVGFCRGAVDDWRAVFRRGANPVLILLLGWTIFEFVRVPAPLRGYALSDLLRVADGIAAYLLCAFCLQQPRQTGMVVAGLILMGVCLSLYDISLVGQRGGMTETVSLHESAFGTHENAGSLLVLLLPLAVAFGVSGAIEEKRRLAAAAGALVLGVAEMVARTRSAWIAGFVALLVLAVLAIRFPNGEAPASPGRRRQMSVLERLIASPAALIAAAMFVFLTVAGAAPFVMKRFATLHSALQDESLSVRAGMWSGAARMASERPLLGWGLGVFPVLQSRWTHSGMDIDEALRHTIGHENLAHDYYVQWAADTGAIGLFLYVTVIVVVLITACQALRRTTTPPRRALLCGGIATIVGAMVDAIASPAYHFHGVSTVFWCVVGLTAAAAQYDPRAAGKLAEPPPGRGQTILAYAVAVVCGLVVAGGVIGAGFAVVRHGLTVRRGTLEIASLAPGGVLQPGQPAKWVAIFHDGGGSDLDTASGALWNASAGAGLPSSPAWQPTASEVTSHGVRHGIVRVITPDLVGGARDGVMTMQVSYEDRYSRWYTAYSAVEVRGAARPATTVKRPQN